jgi:hypothetical protein
MATNIRDAMEAREVLKAARWNAQTNWDLMSAYEQKKRTQEIEEIKTQWKPRIEADALGKFQTMVNRVLLAKAKAAREKNMEMNRWDMQKVSSTIAVTKERLKADIARDNPESWVTGVKQLLKEAESGDIQYQRGVYEAVREAVNFVPRDDLVIRMAANRVASEAEQKLNALRVTEAMVEADTAVQEAVKNVKGQWHDVAAAAESMGEQLFGPFGGSPALEKGVYKMLIDADPELANEFFRVKEDGIAPGFEPTGQEVKNE